MQLVETRFPPAGAKALAVVRVEEKFSQSRYMNAAGAIEPVVKEIPNILVG